MEPTPHPLTLTVEQAAKLLGIGRSTAYELVHTGANPSLRLGRRIVVPTAKLADQLGVLPQEVVTETSPPPESQAAHRSNPLAASASLSALRPPPDSLF